MKAKAFALLIFLLTFTARAFPEPKLGLVVQHGSAYDISVIFTEPVDVGSLGNPENYSVSPGSIAALRLCATNQGVILTVNGLQPGLPGVVNISGVMDPGGNLLPGASLEFTVGNLLWATIGANELGLNSEVVSLPDDGFDLFSGGIQQRDEYDDATFVGEKISGNFDVKVRVDYVDPAGAGAKAGIMIREELDAGRTRPLDPDDPAQAFSRYLELSVQAPRTVLDQPGAGHQIWQRAVSPSIDTLSLTVTNDAPPAFTNAWLRIERTGQQFNLYRGVDGVVWQQIGGATFNPPLATNVYVGLAFSPQNDDIPASSGLRKSFVAKFRDYELTPTTSAENNLRIQIVGDHAEVRWDSDWTLQTAPTVFGDWSDLTTATSPYRVDLNQPMRFFRLRH
jgi:hypothetical protein